MGPLNPHQGCNTKFCLQIPTPTINVHLCKKSFLSTFSVPITGKIALGKIHVAEGGWNSWEFLRDQHDLTHGFTSFNTQCVPRLVCSSYHYVMLCPAETQSWDFQSPGEQSKPISHWKAVLVYIEGTQFFVSGKSTKINLVDIET